MKKLTSFFMALSCLIICSSCDNRTENSISSDRICIHFGNNISEASLNDTTIYYPALNSQYGSESNFKEINSANGTLGIAWDEMIESKEPGNKIIYLPLTTINDMFLIRQEEYRNSTRAIVCPIYSYIKLSQSNGTNEVHSEIVSFCPDYRFLKKYESDFNAMLKTDDIMNEYTGLKFFSGFDGIVKKGVLLFKGKSRYELSQIAIINGTPRYMGMRMERNLRKLKFRARELSHATRSDSDPTGNGGLDWQGSGFSFPDYEQTTDFCNSDNEDCSCSEYCEDCNMGTCRCWPCTKCPNGCSGFIFICVTDSEGNCDCDDDCSECGHDYCNCNNCIQAHSSNE